MNTPHKHCDLIVAWANGAEIQFFDDGEWIDCHENGPRWHEEMRYRIKPKIVKREGWLAVYRETDDPYPPVCGIYESEEECRQFNDAKRLIRIEWEEEE